MANNGNGQDGSSGIQIVVALIGLFGVLGVALINNWTEIFSNTESASLPSSNLVESAKLEPSDISDLQTFLATQQFRNADRETRRIMLQLSGRENEAWIDKESIERVSCEDLRLIDDLWQSYTQDQFGFTTQKALFQSTGKNEEFGELVGWRKDESWLTTSDLDYSLNAPSGHLPSASRDGSLSGGWLSYYLLSDTFSEASSCIADK